MSRDAGAPAPLRRDLALLLAMAAWVSLAGGAIVVAQARSDLRLVVLLPIPAAVVLAWAIGQVLRGLFRETQGPPLSVRGPKQKERT